MSQYRDSALEPRRIFAKDLPKEAGILVRIDDKLNRLEQGNSAGEDTEGDLLGYLVLLKISKLRAARSGR